MGVFGRDRVKMCSYSYEEVIYMDLHITWKGSLAKMGTKNLTSYI